MEFYEKVYYEKLFLNLPVSFWQRFIKIIFRADLFTRPNLCALVLIAICAFLCVPVIGLTGFHMVLVFRARTTNEQVSQGFEENSNKYKLYILVQKIF